MTMSPTQAALLVEGPRFADSPQIGRHLALPGSIVDRQAAVVSAGRSTWRLGTRGKQLHWRQADRPVAEDPTSFSNFRCFLPC